MRIAYYNFRYKGIIEGQYLDNILLDIGNKY